VGREVVGAEGELWEGETRRVLEIARRRNSGCSGLVVQRVHVGQLRAVLQLAVFEVELLRYLPPVEDVEEDVRPSLVRARLGKQFHARRSRYPDSLFFVIPPVTVVPVRDQTDTDR